MCSRLLKINETKYCCILKTAEKSNIWGMYQLVHEGACHDGRESYSVVLVELIGLPCKDPMWNSLCSCPSHALDKWTVHSTQS
jgi:hypothetical protein